MQVIRGNYAPDGDGTTVKRDYSRYGILFRICTGGTWGKWKPFIDLTPYLAKSDAAGTYLKQTDAADTYLKQTDAAVVLRDLPASSSDTVNFTGTLFGATDTELKAAIDGGKVIVGHVKGESDEKRLVPVTAAYKQDGEQPVFLLTYFHDGGITSGFNPAVVEVRATADGSYITMDVKRHELNGTGSGGGSGGIYIQ